VPAGVGVPPAEKVPGAVLPGAAVVAGWWLRLRGSLALGELDLSIGFADVVPGLTPVEVPPTRGAGAPIDPEPLLPRLAPALDAPPPADPPEEPPDDCASAVPAPSTSEADSIRAAAS